MPDGFPAEVDAQAAVTLLAGLMIVAGLAGIVVPVLPGVLLCWGGVLVWALLGDAGPLRWGILVVATLVALVGAVVKYAWPGRNLKRSGVPNRSLLAGGLLGLVGFFVIPLLGLVIGFVLGIYLAELSRLGNPSLAWPSTVQALKAAGLSMLVELGSGLVIAGLWGAGLLLA